jgi:predicted CXXCH cytochrome family protein
MSGAAHSHKEVKGSCVACHNAHAADYKALQVSEPRQSCVACHEDVGKAVAGATVSHDAVLTGDQCIACHEPHAASDAMMLRTDQTPVCLGCHSKERRASDGRMIPEMASSINGSQVVHGAVTLGGCGACHSVHGGQHARLLRELDPAVLGGAFDVRNYALCFACHDQQLALAEAGEVTQFRNGDGEGVNLHRKHLKAGDRSRGCGACHVVHAGGRPRLIADTVVYDRSEWKTPLGFFLTPDGGGCSPGCHEPLRYSRTAAPQREGGAP